MKTIKELKVLWKKLGDIPTTYAGDDVDCIEEKFLHFNTGTHKEIIWHWFEEQNSEFIVGKMLNGEL